MSTIKMSRAGKLATLTVILIATLALPQTPPGTPSHRTASPDPGWGAFMASMAQMHAAMASVQPSGECDADFVRLMLPHHQAAIDMARTQLMYGTDPEMRRLAQEIITDQQSEIELMQLWRRQHQSDSPRVKPATAFRPNQER